MPTFYKSHRRREKKNLTLFGVPIQCKEAPEPSNIKWENQHFTIQQQNNKKLKVILILFVFLCCALVLFTKIKQKVSEVNSRFPPSTDCGMYENYAEQELMKLALLDKASTMQGEGLGMMQCYCEENSNLVDGLTNSIDKEHFCYEYVHDQIFTVGLSLSISLVVVLVNLFLRTAGAYLISKIGLNLNDEMVTNIMTLIFICQYINTAILLVLANANFQDTPLSFFGLSNQYKDYSHDWYLVVGTQLQQTMLFQAFMPYINLLLMLSVKLSQRFIDSRFTMFRTIPHTKKKTI